MSLAREGKAVTILEQLPGIAQTAYLYIVRRLVLEGYLREQQVAVQTRAKVAEINAGGCATSTPYTSS